MSASISAAIGAAVVFARNIRPRDDGGRGAAQPSVAHHAHDRHVAPLPSARPSSSRATSAHVTTAAAERRSPASLITLTIAMSRRCHRRGCGRRRGRGHGLLIGVGGNERGLLGGRGAEGAVAADAVRAEPAGDRRVEAPGRVARVDRDDGPPYAAVGNSVGDPAQLAAARCGAAKRAAGRERVGQPGGDEIGGHAPGATSKRGPRRRRCGTHPSSPPWALAYVRGGRVAGRGALSVPARRGARHRLACSRAAGSGK